MTPPPQLLLASGYTEADQPGIHGFLMDSATGALTPHGALAGIASPSFLVAGPAGELYVASETGDGVVVALRLGPAPGQATELGRQPGGGDWPCHLALNPAATLIAVANYGSGSARLIPRMPDGGLGAPGPVVRHQGSGPHPERQEAPHAHATIFSPDGRFAIVADLGIDRLMVYQVDAAGAALLPHGEAAVHSGAGPRHMAWHPSGRLLYVANELDSTVSSFTFDPATGRLTEFGYLSTLPPGAPHNQVADLHLDAAGSRLYVSNRGHNSIAVFAVGPGGALSPLAIRPCGGDWPRNFALSPDGRFLVVANQHSGQLAVLPVLGGATALGEPVAHAALPGAACVIFPTGPMGWHP
ncbi:MAG: lactonase family protein [Chloroflexi bacterium OHK40]